MGQDQVWGVDLAMTLAIVKVLPDPVIPRSTWAFLPGFNALNETVQWLAADLRKEKSRSLDWNTPCTYIISVSCDQRICRTLIDNWMKQNESGNKKHCSRGVICLPALHNRWSPLFDSVLPIPSTRGAGQIR